MNPPTARIWTQQLLSRGGLGPLVRRSARQSKPFLRVFSSSTENVARGRLATQTLQQNALFLIRGQRSALSRRFRSLRFKSDKQSPQNPDPTPHLGSPEPTLSLSQRLKKLSKQYGWLALGVYMGLTVLDFPFCFLAVRMLGTDRIGHYEHVAVEAIKSVIRIPFPNFGNKAEPAEGLLPTDMSEATAREGAVGYSGEIENASLTGSKAEASLWTQLALAYAIHKTFIFIRIPLTAALLPKVAKTLRGWGYNVGRVKPKSK